MRDLIVMSCRISNFGRNLYTHQLIYGEFCSSRIIGMNGVQIQNSYEVL